MPTVLVIDSDESVTLLLEMVLRRANHRVLTARTGADGIALAQAHQPDVIILDERLPQIGGIEVCVHLKNHPRTQSTPIILTTSALVTDLQGYATRLGADGALRKPYRADDVLVALTPHMLSG